MVYNWLQLENSSLHELALKCKWEWQLWLKRFCLEDGQIKGLNLNHNARPLALSQLDPSAARQLIELGLEEGGGVGVGVEGGLVGWFAGGQQQAGGDCYVQDPVLAGDSVKWISLSVTVIQ